MSTDRDEIGQAAARERWRRIRAIFDLAADESPESWEAIVDREADDDSGVRSEVLKLLAAFREDELRLEDAHLDLGEPAESVDRIGTTVGSYRLVRIIGHGGMGAVYEGVRSDGAFDHRVAVKFIRTPDRGRDIAARFRRERQILATLEHRNIARLLDGGTTPDGEPFFVMEYVEGQPIAKYCDAHHLTVDQRLRLFRQVFAAVEHAHGKLIVHRDLKPANILVGDDGSVKLLDFGVAKLLGAQDGDALATVENCRLFTPEYASPEQLRDEPVSAASDVYALGVVLFEVLSGRRPYDVPSRSPVAALRAAEGDTPRASAIATDDAARFAGERNVARLRHRLTGELDNILRMALRADPTLRYRSVEQFDRDVGRFLAGLPVSAQPDSLGYRTRKFAKRHAAGVTAAVAATLAVIAGTLLVFAETRRAAEEHRWEGTVVVASSLQQLAAMRLQRGELLVADSLLRGATTLCQREPTRADITPTCVLALHDLGVTTYWRGDFHAADSLLRRVITLIRGAPGVGQAVIGGVVAELAQVRDESGDATAADSLYRQASALFEQGGANRSSDWISMVSWFALCLERQGRFAEADSLVRLQVPVVRPEEAGIVVLHLAWIHAQQHQLAVARDEARRGRPSAASALADTVALRFVRIAGTVAALDLRLGNVDRAIGQLDRVLAVASSRYGPDDPRLAEVQETLGEAWMAKRRQDLGLPLLERAAVTFGKRFGAANSRTVAAVHALELARR